MTLDLDKLLWIEFKGLGKKEILEGMGYVVSPEGYLFTSSNEIVKDVEGEKVTIELLKAILPNPEGPGIAFITDISQIERYMENE